MRKLKRLYFALAVLSFLGRHDLFAQDNRGCHLTVKAEENGLLSLNGRPLGTALIFDSPVTIPTFRLRFVDKRTGALVRPSEVSLGYGWKWLQYPYPEHSRGAWSTASDLVSCAQPDSGQMIIPQFDVTPRGWYDGKYTKLPFSNKPKFNGIDVSAVFPGCSSRVTIKPGDARALKGRTVVVKINCQGDATISYEKP
jgi:hypothetical protein